MRPSTSPRSAYTNLTLSVVLMISISLLSLMLYDQLRYQPVMMVDVETIMQVKLDRLQASGLDGDKDQVLQQSRQWAQDLAHEVARLSNDYNAIVLVRPAVIEGATDMTQLIQQRLGGNHD